MSNSNLVHRLSIFEGKIFAVNAQKGDNIPEFISQNKAFLSNKSNKVFHAIARGACISARY